MYRFIVRACICFGKFEKRLFDAPQFLTNKILWPQNTLTQRYIIFSVKLECKTMILLYMLFYVALFKPVFHFHMQLTTLFYCIKRFSLPVSSKIQDIEEYKRQREFYLICFEYFRKNLVYLRRRIFILNDLQNIR